MHPCLLLATICGVDCPDVQVRRGGGAEYMSAHGDDQPLERYVEASRFPF